MSYNPKKFKTLVHYVCFRCSDQSLFGAVKLNKILYMADFLWYAQTGSPLTGAIYMKQEHGPVPSPLVPVRNELEREGILKVGSKSVRVGSKNLRKTCFECHTTPDTSIFAKEEMSFIDTIISSLAGFSGEDLSRHTHRFLWWPFWRMKEEVPYDLVFASYSSKISPETIAWGKQVAGIA